MQLFAAEQRRLASSLERGQHAAGCVACVMVGLGVLIKFQTSPHMKQQQGTDALADWYAAGGVLVPATVVTRG
jgi:hypothetical protein